MTGTGKNKVAVIGAGVAGIAAAVALEQSGIGTDLFEREEVPGGHLNEWHALFPGRENAAEIRDHLVRDAMVSGVNLITHTAVVGMEKRGKTIRLTTRQGDSEEYAAVVIASGFKLFDASRKEEYGYGLYPRVITSPELEKKLEDPGGGLSVKGQPPRRVAFVHCVGSRDAKVGNLYCSRVCCVTGVKQAIEVRERYPSCEVMNFYMDLRMFGQGYEELYQEAQEKYHITFIRGRVSEAGQTMDGAIQIKAEDTLLGRPLKVTVDWLVLLVGMEPSLPGTIVDNLGLKRDPSMFLEVRNKFLTPGASAVDGVFLAGTCTGPASIPEAVSQGRSVAFSVIQYLRSGS